MKSHGPQGMGAGIVKTKYVSCINNSLTISLERKKHVQIAIVCVVCNFGVDGIFQYV